MGYRGRRNAEEMVEDTETIYDVYDAVAEEEIVYDDLLEDYNEDEFYASVSYTKSKASTIWSNIGFLLLGILIGTILGAMGHLLCILHGNLPPNNISRKLRHLTYSSDH